MAQYRSPYSNFYSEKTGSYMNIGSIVPALVDSYSTNIYLSGEGSKLNNPNDPDSDVKFPPHYAYKGFLYCDGSSYDIKKFPQLFEIIRGNYTTDFENIDSINFSEHQEPGSLYRVFIHGGDLYAEFYSEDNNKYDSDANPIFDRLIPNGAKLTFKDIKDFPMGGGSRVSTFVEILNEDGDPIDEDTDNPFLNDVTTIPVVSTADIAEGMKVKGSNLRSDITVSSVTDGVTLVLSDEVNLTNGEKLTFINPGVIEEGVEYPLEYLDLYQQLSDHNQGVEGAPQNTHVYRILFTDKIVENNSAIDNPTTESGFVSWPIKILGGDFEKVFNEDTADPNKDEYPFLARQFYGTVPEYHYGDKTATGRTYYPGAKNIIPPFSWNYLANELPKDGTEIVSYEILLENTSAPREDAVHWHIRNLPPTFTAFPSNLPQEEFDELIAQGAEVLDNAAVDDLGYDPKFVNYGYTGPQPENEADAEQTNQIYRFYVVAILNRTVPDNPAVAQKLVTYFDFVAGTDSGNPIRDVYDRTHQDSTIDIAEGMEVTGDNLGSGITVDSVTNGTTIELSEEVSLAINDILTFTDPGTGETVNKSVYGETPTENIVYGMTVTGSNIGFDVTVASVTNGTTLELSEAVSLADDEELTFTNLETEQTVSTFVDGAVNASTTVVVDTTAGIVEGRVVTGGNLVAGVTVASVTNATTLDLSEEVSLANNVNLTFTNLATGETVNNSVDGAVNASTTVVLIEDLAVDESTTVVLNGGGITGELGPFFEVNNFVEGDSSGVTDTGDVESLADVKIADLTEQPVE